MYWLRIGHVSTLPGRSERPSSRSSSSATSPRSRSLALTLSLVVPIWWRTTSVLVSCTVVAGNASEDAALKIAGMTWETITKRLVACTAAASKTPRTAPQDAGTVLFFFFDGLCIAMRFLSRSLGFIALPSRRACGSHLWDSTPPLFLVEQIAEGSICLPCHTRTNRVHAYSGRVSIDAFHSRRLSSHDHSLSALRMSFSLQLRISIAAFFWRSASSVAPFEQTVRIRLVTGSYKVRQPMSSPPSEHSEVILVERQR